MRFIKYTAAVAAITVSASAMAYYNDAPVRSVPRTMGSIYVTASGGASVPVQTHTIYEKGLKINDESGVLGADGLNAGYNYTAAAGFVIPGVVSRGGLSDDVRLELQYTYVNQKFSDVYKTFINNAVKDETDAKLNNADVQNMAMVNAIYDLNFNQQFTFSGGVGLGWAHVGAMFDDGQDHLKLFNKHGNVIARLGSAENDFVGQFILGTAYHITPELAFGVNYRFVGIFSYYGGEDTYKDDDGDKTKSKGIKSENLFNASLTFTVPMGA